MDKSDNKTKSFKDLVVWQKAHAFVLSIYQQVKIFPDDYQAIVGDMLCESATAVATNIVGGYKKKDREDKLLFLTTAQEALEECRYYITLATDLHLLDSFQADELDNNLNEVSYLLNSYARSIKRRKAGENKKEDDLKDE